MIMRPSTPTTLKKVRKEVFVPRGKGNVITAEIKAIGQEIVGKKVVGRKDKVLNRKERKTRTKGRARVKLRKRLQLRKMTRITNCRKRRRPGWQWSWTTMRWITIYMI